MDRTKEHLDQDNLRFNLQIIAVSMVCISLAVLLLLQLSTATYFLRSTDIVISSFLSLLLVLLYRRQTKIQGTQADIQEEQTNILRATETPEVILNEFIYLFNDERDSCGIGGKFTNTGNGLAKDFTIYTRLDIRSNSELHGGRNRRGLKRPEHSDIHGLRGDYVRPGEDSQLLTADLHLKLMKTDEEGESEWGKTYEFEEAVNTMAEHGVDRIMLVWDIEWRDSFGESSDTFGNKYHEQTHLSGHIHEGMSFREFIEENM